VQTAGGVNDDRVEPFGLRFAERALRAGDRVHRVGLIDAHLGLVGHDRELLDGGRTADVGGHHQGMAALPFEPASELSRRGGLARPLQPEQQHDAGSAGVFGEAALGIAKEGEHLVADDLDDLLTGRQALEHCLIHRPIADPVDERLDDLEVDVGFEQRHPDLAERRFDVIFGQAHLAPERLEGVLDAGAQRLEHGRNDTGVERHRV
jgi:hypothetical protein